METDPPLIIIDNNRVVSMHYQLSNGFGEVIDSSLGGLPLVYMHNTSALLPSLERELTGAMKGDNLDVVIYPEDGYGYAQDELVQEMDIELFKDIDNIVEGMRIRATNDSNSTQMLTVKEIRDDVIVVDSNHPLAGQVLHFNIAVVAVREPTAEELKQGFATTSNVPSNSPVRGE